MKLRKLYFKALAAADRLQLTLTKNKEVSLARKLRALTLPEIIEQAQIVEAKGEKPWSIYSNAGTNYSTNYQGANTCWQYCREITWEEAVSTLRIKLAAGKLKETDPWVLYCYYRIGSGRHQLLQRLYNIQMCLALLEDWLNFKRSRVEIIAYEPGQLIVKYSLNHNWVWHPAMASIVMEVVRLNGDWMYSERLFKLLDTLQAVHRYGVRRLFGSSYISQLRTGYAYVDGTKGNQYFTYNELPTRLKQLETGK